MRGERHTSLPVLVVLVTALAMPGAAHAYLDPGTGSFVLQMVLAAVLAVGASLKVLWGRIRCGAGRTLGREKRGGAAQ
jgi:hypothetical protein